MGVCTSCLAKDESKCVQTPDANGAKPNESGIDGRSTRKLRRRQRHEAKARRVKRGFSRAHSSAQMSLSAETVYFDADDQSISEDGPRLSAYQDGIDEYPAPSPSDTSPRSPFGGRTAAQLDRAATGSEEYVEPDMPSPHCLPGLALPRVFSSGDGVPRQHRFVRLSRPPAGSSIGPKDRLPYPAPLREPVPEGAPAHGASLEPTSSGIHPSPIQSWEDSGSARFLVRTREYHKTKRKDFSEAAMYRLLAVDLYSFDFKLSHIAQHVQLPQPPQLGELSTVPLKEQLPPLLIVNVQLPDYPASLWAKGDGPGFSMVYYFGLPEGWTPDSVPNKAALGLAQRFMHGAMESDNSLTRDRLKLMPRVVNVEEWATAAPLSGTEQALLRRYNDKPLLTRPQHKFFSTPLYLEIDLDVHNYAYLARKAFTGFESRLDTVVFDNAFIIQGNKPDELPEQVLAAARLSHVDFRHVRPFPADMLDKVGSADDLD